MDIVYTLCFFIYGSSLKLTNHFLYKQEAVKIAERISDTLGLQGDVEVINDPSKLTGKSD